MHESSAILQLIRRALYRLLQLIIVTCLWQGLHASRPGKACMARHSYLQSQSREARALPPI